jgi:hypothetical protein
LAGFFVGIMRRVAFLYLLFINTKNQPFTMTELINKLVAEAGLSTEQAGKTIEVIKGFVSEKFPMLAGAVENVLGASTASSSVPDITETPSANGGSWLDKISDVIPGDLGEKIEGFAKNAGRTGQGQSCSRRFAGQRQRKTRRFRKEVLNNTQKADETISLLFFRHIPVHQTQWLLPFLLFAALAFLLPKGALPLISTHLPWCWQPLAAPR